MHLGFLAASSLLNYRRVNVADMGRNSIASRGVSLKDDEMKAQVLALTLGLVSTPASAADIDIDVQELALRFGMVQADLKVTNNLPSRVGPIYINCSFLDANRRFIDVGRGLVAAIDPSSVAYTKAAIVTDKQVRSIECVVSNPRG